MKGNQPQMNYSRRLSIVVISTCFLFAGAQSGHSALPESNVARAGKDNSTVELLKRHVDPRQNVDNSTVAFSTPFGQLDWTAIRTKIYEKNGAYFVDHENLTLELTLKPELHRGLQQIVKRERHIGAGVVMLDSATGAIQAIAELTGEPENPLYGLDNQVTKARAPAASLMKMITAAAAIQEAGMSPGDEISFRGGCQYLKNRNWLQQPKADRSKFTLARAFATSCNTAFARLAIYQTGLASLRDYADRFFMNRPIPSDLLLETSLAAIPELESATMFDVGEAGAGFGFTKLTPVHAALLSAAIANEGRMMAPHLVKRAMDASGNVVYTAEPREIGSPIAKETASKMMVLMKATVWSGTSRSQFMRRDTRNFRTEIGGKTGTLRDMEDRKTLYTWFSGVGSGNEVPASLAVGVLVASPVNWIVRASSVAQYGFSQFYESKRKSERIARGRKN
jgi:peptidoglycan glycosyltransferase